MSSEGRQRAPRAAAGVPPAVALYGSFRMGQYFEDILAGVMTGAEATGAGVISIQPTDGVLPSSWEIGGQQGVSRVAWNHFDSAVIILQTVSRQYVDRLRAAGKFLVAIGQEPRGSCATVAIDNAGGVEAAVRHLIEHGHSAISFLCPSWHPDALERYAAYRNVMERSGLPPMPLMAADVPAEPSMTEQGHLAARRFLADRPRCTAVLVGTDRFALGFMRTLQEGGVDVPGEVAIVGIDDIDEAAVSSPPLATVAISFRRVGETAFDVALRGGRGEPMQARHLVPQRFIARESCGCSSSSAASDRDSSLRRDELVGSLVAALAAPTYEQSIHNPVDIEVAEALAGRIVTFLTRLPDGVATGGALLADLAQQINEWCPRDQSVRGALRAVRALSEGLAACLPGGTASGPGSINAATLDLCDAVRSGQLQRRLTELVDLKSLQERHYSIGNTLLGHDRTELRSMAWLQETDVHAGALGLWEPPGQTDLIRVHGVHERSASDGRPPEVQPCRAVPVESFPPAPTLRDATGAGRLVVVTQIRFENSDWGLMAVAGGGSLRSLLVQETFQQWSVLMSTSLAQEKADIGLAQQAAALTTAYEKEMTLLEEVRISEERYALAAEAGQDALWDWDVASGQVFYSSRWKALLDHRDHEIGTSPGEWLDRVHPDDVAALREHLDRALTRGEPYLNVEHRLRVRTGEYRWIACSARSVTDATGRPVRLVGSVTDVTLRRVRQEQLLQEARFDQLTGLVKGAGFKDRLAEAMERGRRRPGYRFAVLFIDLNGFKTVNDTLGHAAGDQLLSSVARRLQDALRENDVAARLGGDEFAVLLDDLSEPGVVPVVVERITTVISRPHPVGGRTAVVGAAIGVALSESGYTSPDEMLHDADLAMYQAKSQARQGLLGAEHARPDR